MAQSLPKHETPRATDAFERYYNLGPHRSVRRLATEWIDPANGKPAANLRQIEMWSSAFHWQDRVRERDRERAEAERREADEAIRKMNARHAQIGVTHQLAAIEQIKRLRDIEKFGSVATVQLLKLALDTERVARGVPAEIVEQQHSGAVGHSVVFVLPELVEETARGFQTEQPPAENG